jgi:hypothetical protein
VFSVTIGQNGSPSVVVGGKTEALSAFIVKVRTQEEQEQRFRLTC